MLEGHVVPTPIPNLRVTRPQIPLLTALRFFAAFQVMMVHVIPFEIRTTAWYGPFLNAGNEAVTFFFALSGFILVYVYSGASEQGTLVVSSMKFWRARLARLLPAYVLGLVLMLPTFLYTGLVLGREPKESLVAGFILVPLFLQSWYPPTAIAWNGVAWSLSVEWLFYALFPLLLVAAAGFGRRLFLVGAFATLIAVSLLRQRIAFSPEGFDPNFWSGFIKFFPPFHLSTFLLGMAAGRLVLFGPQLSTASHNLVFVLAALIILSLFGARPYLPSWLFGNAVIVPVFCLAIYGAARASTFTWPPLTTLGEASYALYITHVGIMIWTAQAIKALRIDMPTWLISTVSVLAAIAASLLVHLYIEKPWHRRILQWRMP